MFTHLSKILSQANKSFINDTNKCIINNPNSYVLCILCMVFYRLVLDDFTVLYGLSKTVACIVCVCVVNMQQHAGFKLHHTLKGVDSKPRGVITVQNLIIVPINEGHLFSGRKAFGKLWLG